MPDAPSHDDSRNIEFGESGLHPSTNPYLMPSGIPSMKEYLRWLRRFPAVLLGRDVYFRAASGRNRRVERLGSACAGWSVLTDRLGPDSIVYCVGVGEDISFDLSLMNRFGLCVHAFDPTPKAIKWVRSQNLSERFVLHEYGLAAVDGEVNFNPPENPNHVSHTILDRPATRDLAIRIPVKRLQTIMQELGHAHIDLLKMDIEGAEYAVLDDLLECGIRPRQILVEFHHRFPDTGVSKTKASVAKLGSMGYILFSVSDNGEEFGFVRQD